MSDDLIAERKPTRVDDRRKQSGAVWIYASFGLSTLIMGYAVWTAVCATWMSRTPSMDASAQTVSYQSDKNQRVVATHVEIRERARQSQANLVARVRRQSEDQERHIKRVHANLSLDAEQADRSFAAQKREAATQLERLRQQNRDNPPPADSVLGKRMRDLELMAAGRD